MEVHHGLMPVLLFPFGSDCERPSHLSFTSAEPAAHTHRVLWGADEHYMSTLLATQGRDEETDCSGSVTHANWDDIEHFFHPKTYQVHEVTAQLLFGLRQPQHVRLHLLWGENACFLSPW